MSYSQIITRFSWIFPIRHKSEVFTHFQNFLAFVENRFSTTIKYFQSDGGKAYDNYSFHNLCA